jgi:ABC-2 type transport system permease protein
VTPLTYGALSPRPGAAPLPRMILSQAGFELRLLRRNGEQLLVTLVIPVLVLVLGATVDLGFVDGDQAQRLDLVAPGVLALAVLSSAFTSQAIATGFERRYGALKRLGATPLPRSALLAGKTLAVLAVETLQVAVLVAVALALGWSPHGGVLGALVLLLAGTAAFSGLGLLLAGTLRAEATLAVANLVYVLLLVGGGILVPVDRFPDAAAPILHLLPSTALADGLRLVLAEGAGLPMVPLLVLSAWAVAATAAAAATFRWE